MKRITLDTSACIYFLEGQPRDPRNTFVTGLVDQAERGAAELFASPITVAELLVAPLRAADVRVESMVRLFVSRLCTVALATEATGRRAATLRARHGIRLADAFILATGIETGSDEVIGNNAAWRRVAEVRYVHIDDEIASGPA